MRTTQCTDTHTHARTHRYVGKGHGGQKRAFKVKLLGEGVHDYGGPYRAVFESVVRELQSDVFGTMRDGHPCILPFLVPAPNRASKLRMGTGGDSFLFNPAPTARTATALAFYEFLGKVVGMAVRHGIQLSLQLPSLVWRSLAGMPVGLEDFAQVDAIAAQATVQAAGGTGAGTDAGAGGTTAADGGVRAAAASDGSTALLLPLDEEGAASAADVARATVEARLRESEPQIAAFKAGLACVLPVELLSVMGASEVEELVCGVPQVDMSLLKQVTEYDDGVDATAPHVQWLWEVLEEASPEQRSAFLIFVWARSRMPSSAAQFPMPFKLKRPTHVPEGEVHDKYLPHAATCFFQLSLPEYSSKEILRQRLWFAVDNSPNMDADVRLHSAEGWAGV